MVNRYIRPTWGCSFYKTILETKKNKGRIIGMQPLVARMLMRLFYACYRLGVNHAAEVRDEGLCLSHIEKTREPGIFGTIVDEYASNYLFWQLRLCKLAIDNSISSPFDKFRRSAGRLYRNYYSVAYEIAQDFYNAGLKDYCDYPSGCDIRSFNNCEYASRAKWTKSGIKKLGIERWVSDAQEFALQRRYISEHSDAKIKAKDSQYVAFLRGIKNASVVSYEAMT